MGGSTWQLAWLGLPCGVAIAAAVWAQMASEEARVRAELASIAAELARSEQARVKAEKLRHEERTGRTRAEKRIQEICQSLPPDADVSMAKSQRRSKPASGGMPSRASRRTKQLPTFSYQAIGEIASCFIERNGCPRQGKISPSSRAWLQLRGDINPAGCTDGLAEYTHLQIIFVFHANTNLDKTATTATGQSAVRFKAKIAPPRLQGSRKVGTLATRSPHRPNPIGLSTARIEGVDPVKGRVLLSGLDLLDGTPVLDIKPYIPDYDSVPEALVPDWVREPGGAGAMAAVRWAPGARERLAIAAARNQGKALRTLPDVESVSAVAEEVLAWDVRSTVKRQRDTDSGARQGAPAAETPAHHKIMLDGLEIQFQIVGERVVEIVDFVAIGSGGRKRGLPSSSSSSVAAARGLRGLRAAAVEPAVSSSSARPALTSLGALKEIAADVSGRPQPQVAVTGNAAATTAAATILRQPPPAVVASVSDRSEKSSMRWLILGDGDFSFSLSIATACGGCISPAPSTAANVKGAANLLLVASSLDSQEVLALKYGPGVLENLAKLRALGALVIHGVDATRLLPTLKHQLAEDSGSDWMGDGFDRVTFQFPLCGATLSKADFEAAAVPAELRNRHLIAETLRGSAAVLKPEGELIISAKADNKYDMRFFCKHPCESGLSAASQSAAEGEGCLETVATSVADSRGNDMLPPPLAPPSLVYATQWLFDISQYPGYTPRNVETNESFPIANSVSFAFVHQGRLDALGLIPSSNFSRSPAYEDNTSGAAKPSCELCGIVCSGQSAFDAHMKGTKHRRNAALDRKWQAFWTKRQQLDKDGGESGSS
eukprot:COSAG02_NODE_103_length_36570_cov_25.164487_7_plen_831_part_00